MRRARALSRFATTCVAVFLTILVLEHLEVPRLEPAQHMISEYAKTDGALGVAGAAALALWGMSLIATAALAWVASPGGGNSAFARRGLVLMLLAAGLGLLLAAACPTQAVRGVVPPGVTVRLSGQVHDASSSIAQMALFAGAILSSRVVADRRFQRATIAVVIVGLAVGPALAAAGAGDRGLRQRILVAGACAWELGLIASLAVHVRRRDRCREEPPAVRT